MEKLTGRMELFHILFWLCLGGCFLFLAGAAVLFFRLRIREAFASVTQLRKRKEIRKKLHRRLWFAALLAGGLWLQAGLYAQSSPPASCKLRLQETPLEEIDGMALYGAEGVTVSFRIEAPGQWEPSKVEFSIVDKDRNCQVVGINGADEILQWTSELAPDVSENTGESVSGNNVPGNTVSGNRVSGNTVSGNRVSENTVSENRVSENTVSGNTVSGNGVPVKVYKAEYQFKGIADVEAVYYAQVHYQGQVFQSEAFVVDRKSPGIQLVYQTLEGASAEAVQMVDGRMFYQEPVVLVVRIEEAYGCFRELKEQMKEAVVTDFEGKPVVGSLEKSLEEIEEMSTASAEGVCWELELSTDANYDLPIAFEDLAGNRTVYGTERISVDGTKPELELVYQVEEAGFWDAVHYRDFGFVFADRKLTAAIEAKDSTAGIEKIGWMLTGADGEVREGSSMQFVIPLLEEDAFQGNLQVCVTDFAGNQVEELRTIIIEGKQTHEETAKLVLETLTEPSRIVDGQAYYNSDVELELTMEDSLSGIREYSYVCGTSGARHEDFRERAGTDWEKAPEQERVLKVQEHMILKAEENNQNDVCVAAEYTDNADHRKALEKAFCIDVSVPRVEVKYDVYNPQGRGFYNQPRTATVTVWERNFRESDMKFQIENSEGDMPTVSAWTHGPGKGDETMHTCKVTFSKDGDYTFSLSFQDLAGNVAEYQRIDVFTIDCTRPVLKVQYDNLDSRNGFYFNRPRTAVLTVEEQHFDEERMVVDVTVEEGTAAAPFVSPWKSEGNVHRAQIVFEADAGYRLSVSGCDEAGNALENYVGDVFVIDGTSPELEILYVENFSANNGVVTPGIWYEDQNSQKESLEISLKGYRNGMQNRQTSIRHTEKGVLVLFEDFPYLEQMDDMYVLEVQAWDLAGNYNSRAIMFSVNRFGSVYTFSEETEELLTQIYTKEAPELVVTETNVDSLKFQKITCSRNGQWRILEEGTDYTVERKGSGIGWKQYTYQIRKENFQEEGRYLLNLYSEDRAENPSDNMSRGKRIEFVVDGTAPSILLAGIADQGRYGEAVRRGILDIQDNLLLERVHLYLNGKERVYRAEELLRLEGKIEFEVTGKNEWQTLRVQAYDAAGNTAELETVEFLVTANVLVQFFENKPLFLGTTGILILAASGAGVIFAQKRRKKRKKKIFRSI